MKVTLQFYLVTRLLSACVCLCVHAQEVDKIKETPHDIMQLNQHKSCASVRGYNVL